MKRHDLWTRIMARTIGTIAPKTAMRFAASRVALASYIGAGGSDHNAQWRPSRKSADAILRTDVWQCQQTAKADKRRPDQSSGHPPRKVQDIFLHPQH